MTDTKVALLAALLFAVMTAATTAVVPRIAQLWDQEDCELIAQQNREGFPPIDMPEWCKPYGYHP